MKQSLQVKDISKSYTNLSVLNKINLQVHAGEFVSIIGPSGCGKTTLLNIIAGVEKESSGSVLINNKKTTNSRGLFGYMPQEPSLLPWRNVLQNITLGPEIQNVSTEKSRKKAELLLREFGLKKFINNYPSTLSGGMAQKVALLRTVMFNKSFLLLDEPFGSLDALTRQTMQFWLLDVWKKFGSTVLLITHDIREAILLSDRVYVVSSRPGSIAKEVAINLPHPRSHKVLLAKKAIEYEKELISLLFERTQ